MFLARLKQTAWQLPLLILAAGSIALAINHWRPDGIPLIGNWSVNARFSDVAGNSLVVSLAEAGRLFRQGGALFVDARPRGQYAQGHIRGALSLPGQNTDRYFLDAADRLDSAKTIIAYCDGEQCELSHELALFLKEMGFDNVRVLVNGWTAWLNSGLPTEIGP